MSNKNQDHYFTEKEMQLITQHVVMPENLNPNHQVFGGTLLAWLDKDLYIFTATQLKFSMLVTGSMNHIRFKKPAYLGEIIRFYGKIKEIKRSSVTTTGLAMAFHPETQATREIIECDITFVALNAQGKVIRIKPA